MPFYPPEAHVPSDLRTPESLLRPLRATHVELDYDAVMSSAEMLRRWSLSDWPCEGFTLGDNLTVLQWHEREHEERIAFTFTLMTPDESECLGCVYVKPLPPSLVVAGAQLGNYPACVSFWARQARVRDSLDARVLATLREWFATSWRFSGIVFRTSTHDPRQSWLFAEAGLLLRKGVESPDHAGHWLAYSEPAPPRSV